MRVGFTSSFPVEIAFAAGHTPVDMNNLFITGSPTQDVNVAESKGYPRNVCSWIKGMYAVALRENFDAVIGIVQGDCSNTHSLMATLEETNAEIIPFSFPYDRTPESMRRELNALCDRFGVTLAQAEDVKRRLDIIRRKLNRLDDLTWRDGKATGRENHWWMLNATDFQGNPDRFERDLDETLKEIEEREPKRPGARIAILGVPPIFTDLHDVVCEFDADVVFNEIQRQFAMPEPTDSLIEQYLAYTYPYSAFERAADIQSQLELRKPDGVVSYVQSFCHRQIDDAILKKRVDLPYLTLEGDQPGPVDERTRLRLESFVEILTT